MHRCPQPAIERYFAAQRPKPVRSGIASVHQELAAGKEAAPGPIKSAAILANSLEVPACFAGSRRSAKFGREHLVLVAMCFRP